MRRPGRLDRGGLRHRPPGRAGRPAGADHPPSPAAGGRSPPLAGRQRRPHRRAAPGRCQCHHPLTRDDAEPQFQHDPQTRLFDGTTGALLASRAMPAAPRRRPGRDVRAAHRPLRRAAAARAAAAVGARRHGHGRHRLHPLGGEVRQQARARRPVASGWSSTIVPPSPDAVAMAASLVPPGVPPVAGRAEWEIHLSPSTGADLLLHPLLRRGRQAWIEQFAAGGLTFALRRW